MCITYASTKTAYQSAKRINGPSNTAAITLPQSIATKNNLNIVHGSDVTAPAETLTPTGKPMAKRPDFRQEYQGHPEFYCRKRFMGSFAQSDCYAWMQDPDHDKCLFQSFDGKCDRGNGLE